MTQQNEPRLTVKVSPDVHQEMALESVQRRIPIYALVAEAWEGYKAAKSSADIHPGPTKAPIEMQPRLDARFEKLLSVPVTRKLAEQFAAILESGNDNATGALTENLEIFADYVQIKAAGRIHPTKRRTR